MAHLHHWHWTLISVEHWVAELEIVHHLDGEGIALLRPVESHNNYGRRFCRIRRIVRDFDVLSGEGGVGFGDGDWSWRRRHCERERGDGL